MESIWEACDCSDVKDQYYTAMSIYLSCAYAAGIVAFFQIISSIAFFCAKPKEIKNTPLVNEQPSI